MGGYGGSRAVVLVEGAVEQVGHGGGGVQTSEQAQQQAAAGRGGEGECHIVNSRNNFLLLSLDWDNNKQPCSGRDYRGHAAGGALGRALALRTCTGAAMSCGAGSRTEDSAGKDHSCTECGEREVPPPKSAAVLVCVIGLPGAGKTTLCRSLQAELGRALDRGAGALPAAAEGSFHVVHLCFDSHLEPPAVGGADSASATTAPAEGRVSGGKEERPAATAQDSDKGSDHSEKAWDGDLEQGASAWKEARAELLRSRVEAWLAGDRGAAAADLCAGNCGARTHVFLLDDNFYYASMRHTVFQLARQCLSRPPSLARSDPASPAHAECAAPSSPPPFPHVLL